jgi:hypothetical protein
MCNLKSYVAPAEPAEFEIELFHRLYIHVYNEVAESGRCSYEASKRALDEAFNALTNVWGIEVVHNDLTGNYLVFNEQAYSDKYIETIKRRDSNERA